MALVLRNRSTGEFWAGSGPTKRREEAQQFETTLAALSCRRKNALWEFYVAIFDQSSRPAKRPRLIDLTLYISSQSSRSEEAQMVLRSFVQKFLTAPESVATIRIVDIATQPQQVLEASVLAVPTLIMQEGKQVQRLVGIFTEVDLFRLCLLPGQRAKSGNAELSTNRGSRWGENLSSIETIN